MNTRLTQERVSYRAVISLHSIRFDIYLGRVLSAVDTQARLSRGL